MASIRRTLSPYRDRPYQNGGAAFPASSQSHKVLSTGKGSATGSTFTVGIRQFLDGLFLQRHSRKGHHTWRRSFYRCLLFFFLGFLLGMTPFGSVDDIRSHDFSFEIKPPAVNVQEDVDSVNVDMVELGAERRFSMKERFDFVPRKPLIVVTPTYNRALQAYYLNRLGQVLRLVPPPLLWIVVEMNSVSMETAEMLRKTGVMYRHLVCTKNSTNVKDRGVHQRNTALEHIEHHKLDGIVYFADDDNIYSFELFEGLREISRFGTWPVAMLEQRLFAALDAEVGTIEHRQFPDGETYLRVVNDVSDREVILLSSLDHPDAKLLPLLFAADTAREMGARRIGLVAPYLAYMRQDIRFHPGEAVTSRTFAAILSRHLDWLVTVDPHLHRYHALSEIYRIPTQIVHAAPLLASWIKRNVARPLIIGPDLESEQWVSQVAADADAPFLVCEKIRSGDRDVTISIPNAPAFLDRQPVLVDDIASSGRTLAEAARQLVGMGFARPHCVVVHPLFAGDAAHVLGELVERIVSTNAVAHTSNKIDVMPAIAEAVRHGI